MIETNGPGGAENMLVHLAVGLRRRGIEAFPIIPWSKDPSWLEHRLLDAGFPPLTFTIKRPLDPVAVATLKRHLAHTRAELVHSHEFSMAVYGRAASWLARRPHVVTMHGGTGFAARGRRRRALGWALRSSEARVAVSETAADFLAATCSVPRVSIDVIPNGVEITPGNRRRVRTELGIADDASLIVAVGNLYPVKGHKVLIEAAHLLNSTEAGQLPWTIAIAGRGQEEDALRARIAARGLTERVRLLGLRTDIPDLLAAADAFVMPSLSEGLPLALLEAMGAGIGTIASAVGGIPTIVRDGETGLLVPPGDVPALASSIRRLLAGGEATRLGQAAAADIPKRFGLDAMTNAYVEVYRRVLHTPPNAAERVTRLWRS